MEPDAGSGPNTSVNPSETYIRSDMRKYAKVIVGAAAADLLNKTFGITALKGGSKTGTKVGVATIKATGTT
jgi:hypothetical protein